MKKDKDFETHTIRIPSLVVNGEPVTLQLFSEGGVLVASTVCVGEDYSEQKAYDLPLKMVQHILVGILKFCDLDPIP